MYNDFYDLVYAYVFRRTGPDQAEDVVAAVFLTAWRKISEVPPGREALFWLYRVAYRTLGNHWRSAKRRMKLRARLEGLGAELPIPPEDYVVHDEESQQAIEATKRLKDIDREILLLSIWEQLTNEEIADTLQISRGAVKQRLYRARGNFSGEFFRLSRQQHVLPTAQEGGAR